MAGLASSGTPRDRARAWRCCSTSARSCAIPAMANPTVVMLTDRNDLDDQLFDEVFAPARTLAGDTRAGRVPRAPS